MREFSAIIIFKFFLISDFSPGILITQMLDLLFIVLQVSEALFIFCLFFLLSLMFWLGNFYWSVSGSLTVSLSSPL